jgi:hypothetical protein
MNLDVKNKLKELQGLCSSLDSISAVFESLTDAIPTDHLSDEDKDKLNSLKSKLAKGISEDEANELMKEYKSKQ